MLLTDCFDDLLCDPLLRFTRRDFWKARIEHKGGTD